MSYQEQIFDSIKIITDNAISQLKFDKTVVAEVVSLVDKSSGEYKVKYNGNTFSAFANDLTYTYEEEDNVYVKIPEGNFSNKKFIENKVANKTIVTSEAIDKVVTVGDPFASIAWTDDNGIISAKGTDSCELSYESSAIDNSLLKEYLQFYRNIKVTAQIRTNFTNLPSGGDYGLKIYVDNNAEPAMRLAWANSANFNPYVAGERTVTFEAVFNIATDININEITKVELFCEGMTGSGEDTTHQDIFCDALTMEFVDVLNLTSVPYYLYIVNTGKNTEGNKYILKGEYYLSGQLLDNTAWTKQWYEQDLSATFASNDYDKTAGYGWKKVDGATKDTLEVNLSNPTKRYKLIGIYTGDNTTQVAEIVIKGDDKDLYLVQRNTKLYVEGSYLNGHDLTYTWYISTSNGSYQKIDSSLTKDNYLDFSSYTIYSSIVIYCDVKENDKTVAYLTSEWASNESDNVSVNFVGDDLFKYNANGAFSIEEANRDRVLKININWGSALTSVYKIEWVAPNGNSLANGNKVESIDNSMLTNMYVDAENCLHFNIRNAYDIARGNNFVMVKLYANNQTYVFKKEIAFVRDGDSGTNGTSYAAQIVWCESAIDDTPITGYKALAVNTTGALTARIYNAGELIEIDNNWKFKWAAGGSVAISSGAEDKICVVTAGAEANAAHYVKLQLTNKELGITIYPFFCIDTYSGTEPSSTFSLGNIPQSIMYSSTGFEPSYVSNRLYYMTLNDDNQYVMHYDGLSTENPTPVNLTTRNGVGHYLQPVASLEKANGNMGLIQINYDNTTIYHTIYLHMNLYGNELINGWDGSVDINTSKGYIFAPVIGAGTKHEDNTFTGVLLGQINGKAGIYGQNKEKGTTFYIDENGSCYLAGEIHASGGTIGGWEITESYLRLADNDSIRLSPTDIRLNGLTINSAGAIFEGTINAINGGSIGGWTIIPPGYNEEGYWQPGSLSSGSTYLNSNGTISGATISGATISGATISGATISGGTISGATISGGTISGGTISGGTIKSLYPDGAVGVLLSSGTIGLCSAYGTLAALLTGALSTVSGVTLQLQHGFQFAIANSSGQPLFYTDGESATLCYNGSVRVRTTASGYETWGEESGWEEHI